MALSLQQWPGYLVGSLTFLNAVFNMYCICVHPAFTSGRLQGSSDPFTTYVGGEKVMVDYLKSNPELARRAGAAAVQAARDNPELARQAASGAASAAKPDANSAQPWG